MKKKQKNDNWIRETRIRVLSIMKCVSVMWHKSAPYPSILLEVGKEMFELLVWLEALENDKDVTDKAYMARLQEQQFAAALGEKAENYKGIIVGEG